MPQTCKSTLWLSESVGHYIWDNGCRHLSVVTPVARSTGALSYYTITLLRYADNRIVNIMKVYIERSNFQLELIRFSKLMFSLFTFTFCEAMESPTKRIAGRFELKPVRLRFWQSRPIRGGEWVHG